MKSCILQKSDGIVFSSGNFEKDKKAQSEKNEIIDFTALVRSN